MKKVKWWLPVIIITFTAVSCKTTGQVYDQDQVYQQQDDNDQYYAQPDNQVTFSAFYDGLSPYGNWIDYPSYGRVWVCNQPGFRPYYSNGHWALTSYGWTWVSDYSWGWAPFHYGRWAFDNQYGWFWVPGYEWAPAWVSWRSGGDYYGWAPMQPGLSISINIGGQIPFDRWAFVPRRYITAPRLGSYCVDRGRNNVIINNTTVINNVNVYRNARFEAGPDRRQVEHFTGQRIQPLQVRDATRPGEDHFDNRSLHIYRPIVNNTAVNNRQYNNTNVQRNINQQPVTRDNRPDMRSGDNIPAPRYPGNNQPIPDRAYGGNTQQRLPQVQQRPVTRDQNPVYGNDRQIQTNPRVQPQNYPGPDMRNRNNSSEPPQVIQQRQMQQQREIFQPNRSFTPQRQVPSNMPVQRSGNVQRPNRRPFNNE